MRAVRSSFRVLSSLAVSPARPRRRRVPSYRPHRRAPRLQTSSPNPPAPTLPPSSSGAVTDATPCPAVAHQHNSYGPTRDETTRRLRDRRSPPHLACRALLETPAAVSHVAGGAGSYTNPQNPPRKIVVRDVRGPAANYSQATVIHIVMPTGQVEEPATNHKHQDSGTHRQRRPPPPLSAAPPIFPIALAES